MHTNQAAYRTYVVGIRVPKGSVPRILLWDNGDPYYYVRLTTPDKSKHEILIVGGADHKVGQDEPPAHRYDEIEKWVRQHFPMAGSVDFKWSGQSMEPADGVGYMGRNPMDYQNVYVITGDSGNGMTHCTAGAILVTDLIMGRNNGSVAKNKKRGALLCFSGQIINVRFQVASFSWGANSELCPVVL